MKKLIAIFLASIMLLALLSGCSGSQRATEPAGTSSNTDSTDTTQPTTDDPIVISMCGAITGDYSEYGLGYQAATKIQVDKWNANGGINGRQIVVKEYDEKGEIEEGVAIAQKVVTDSSNYGMVGHFWSIMEAGQIYQEYGVPMIGPAASTMGFTDIGDYIFRNNPTIKTETAAMLDCAQSAGLKKLGVYYRPATGVKAPTNSFRLWWKRELTMGLKSFWQRSASPMQQTTLRQSRSSRMRMWMQF